MVKEVRFGWDDEFGQPSLNIPPHWDNDTDELVDDLNRTRPDNRSNRRKPTSRPHGSSAPSSGE